METQTKVIHTETPATTASATEVAAPTTTTTETHKKKSTSKHYAVLTNMADGSAANLRYLEAPTKTDLLKSLKDVGEEWEIQAVFKGKRLLVNTKRAFSIN